MKGNKIVILSTTLAGIAFFIMATCLTVVMILGDMTITPAMIKNNHLLDYRIYVAPFIISAIVVLASALGICYGTAKDYFGDTKWYWIRKK